MTLAAVLVAVAVGGVVGVASGLLGIGGGILMVPFFYLLMEQPAWSGVVVPASEQAAVAHATSLAVILPAAVAGLLAYRRHGALEWEAIVPLGIAAALAALAGARLAVVLPAEVLRGAFGLLLLYVGGRLLLGKRPAGDGAGVEVEARPLRGGRAIAGGSAIGICSSVLGIGGGLVAIPILIRWAHMSLHRVTPTSLGIVVFAAAAGALSYATAGDPAAGLPPGAVGYVFVPAALALTPGAVLLAPVGAGINRRLPVPVLRRVFGVFLVIVAARILLQAGGVAAA